MTVTVTLSADLNPSSFGDTVTFSVSVVSDDLINFPGPPTGTVTFYDGVNVMATRNLDGSGNTTFSTAALGVGNSPHDISATYNGDGTFDPNTSNHVSQVVNQATTVTTVSSFAPLGTPWNKPPVTYPIGSVIFTGVVTGGGTPTGTVGFYIDDILVFTQILDGGQATYTTELTGYDLGPHSVFVVYSGDANHATSTSDTIIQVVTPNSIVFLAANPVTDTTGYYGSPDWLITTWPLTNPSNEGETVRILSWLQTYATVNGATVYPTGTMTLREGATVLATATLSVGNGAVPRFSYVEFNINSLSPGTHLLTVDYSGLVVGSDTWFTVSSTDGYITGVAHQSGISQVVIPAGGEDTNPTTPVEPTVPEFSTPAPPGEVESGVPAPIVRLCEHKIQCDCLDSPVLNLSSERIDYPGFFCLHFGEQIPTLGTQFGEVSCVSIGNSRVGQDEACLEAAVNSIYCTTTTWTPSTVPPPPLPPPVDPPPGTFGNTEQTAFVTCPSGLVVSYTVPANTFIANTEADADLMALEFAEAYADLLALATPGCVSTTTPPTTPPVIPPPIIYLNHQATCAATCPDGLPFTFTVRAGIFAALNQALADRMAHSYACRQAQLQKICLSSLSQSACCLGSAANITITATGSSLTSFTNLWTITSGALPPGLSFTPIGIGGRTARISGTPTVSGSYSFTVRVSSTQGDFMEKTYFLCVVELLPATLPEAQPGVAYSQLMSTSCGTPTNWRVVTGSLPPGMTLGNGFGILSGTPTIAGSYTFTIQVDVV